MTNLYHNRHNDYDKFWQLISQSQPNTVNMYLYHNGHNDNYDNLYHNGHNDNYDKFLQLISQS